MGHDQNGSEHHRPGTLPEDTLASRPAGLKADQERGAGSELEGLSSLSLRMPEEQPGPSQTPGSQHRISSNAATDQPLPETLAPWQRRYPMHSLPRMCLKESMVVFLPQESSLVSYFCQTLPHWEQKPLSELAGHGQVLMNERRYTSSPGSVWDGRPTISLTDPRL